MVISFRKVIEEILTYEYRKHIIQIEDITKEIRRLPDRNDKHFTIEHIRKLASKLLMDRNKCENFLSQLPNNEDKFITTEVIEMFQKARRQRGKISQYSSIS